MYFFQRTIEDTAEDEVVRRHHLEIGRPQEEDTAGNHYKFVIVYTKFILNITSLIYVVFLINHSINPKPISLPYSGLIIGNLRFL